MSLLCSAAHGSSTATVLPAQRTPQGADIPALPSQSWVTSPPQEPSPSTGCTCRLTEAAVKHTSGLFIVAFSSVMINN